MYRTRSPWLGLEWRVRGREWGRCEEGSGGLAGWGRGAGGAGREVFEETGDGGRCGALLRGGTFGVVTRGNSVATTQATSLTPLSVGLWHLQVVSAQSCEIQVT